MKKTKPESPAPITIARAPIIDPATLPAFLTVDDVAALLRRQRRSVYDLVEKGLIPCSRPPGTRLIIFEKKAILDWLTLNQT